jgi:2-C-methyl-D-erythritol 4-phosphate cytidylyltransferase
MGSHVPKQYLELDGLPILQHTLSRLTEHPQIRGVVVAVSAGDEYWSSLAPQVLSCVTVAPGGQERADSVLSGLEVLSAQAAPDDWVMVHDAARPCVRSDDISKLISTVVQAKACGGLLGLPVRDTMKRTDKFGYILQTVSREQLWHALTPQMFRVQALVDALQEARARAELVTDEASAMQLAGFRPLVVAGHPDNLKITHPSDLQLAELYLRAQLDGN